MLYLSTLRALLVPRRFVPFVLVSGPLLLAQVRLSHHPGALLLGLLMLAAFFLLGPFLWRVFGPSGVGWLRGIGLVLFGVAGAILVFGIGYALARGVGTRTSFMTARESLWIVLAMFWVGSWGLGRDIERELGLEEALGRAEAARRELERAQLFAIRAHFDPHFLFNTLNAIAEWCREDPKVAEEAIVQLSHLLREILAGLKADTWPLSRELELARGLFSLHAIRDPEAFQVITDVDAESLGLAVPPMLLLPLAENAMKHGPGAGHRGEIRLRIARREGRLEIELENPGAFMGPRAGGEGLDLVRQRLLVAYDGRARFDIAAVDGRTRASLSIDS